jgi:carboxyl-terminal processing protease
MIFQKYWFVSIVLLIFLSPGISAGADIELEASPTPQSVPDRSIYDNLELFTRVMEIVNDKYVEDVKRQELIYGALDGMMKSLDDYSQFMEPQVYKEMKVETKGEFGGVGIEITLRGGILTIISPIEDTPGSRAGLHAGDKIVKIEGETTKDITLFEAVKKMRGKPGTEVNITIMRPGEKEFLDFTIVRDIIKIDSVKEVKMLDDEIGYIRLVQFQEHSLEEFEEGLKELEDKGIQALVLDLRWNPGGLLTSAIGIADLFLEKGRLIVETRGRNKELEMQARATSHQILVDVPMVILINKGSASGSEIVAGALRDNYRAVLVGTTSFGKGSVQSVLPLSREEKPPGIRLTTGRYYTASQRVIQDNGIEPDVKVEMSIEEMKEFFKRKYRELEDVEEEEKALNENLDLPEEVESKLPGDEDEENAVEEDNDDEEDEIHDPQLRTAIDILKGILIQKHFDEEAGADS